MQYGATDHKNFKRHRTSSAVVNTDHVGLHNYQKARASRRVKTGKINSLVGIVAELAVIRSMLEELLARCR